MKYFLLLVQLVSYFHCCLSLLLLLLLSPSSIERQFCKCVNSLVICIIPSTSSVLKNNSQIFMHSLNNKMSNSNQIIKNRCFFYARTFAQFSSFQYHNLLLFYRFVYKYYLYRYLVPHEEDLWKTQKLSRNLVISPFSGQIFNFHVIKQNADRCFGSILKVFSIL